MHKSTYISHHNKGAALKQVTGTEQTQCAMLQRGPDTISSHRINPGPCLLETAVPQLCQCWYSEGCMAIQVKEM